MSYVEKLIKMGSNAPSKSGDSSADFRHYLEKLFLWTILTQRLSQDVTIHYLNGRSPITQILKRGRLRLLTVLYMLKYQNWMWVDTSTSFLFIRNKRKEKFTVAAETRARCEVRQPNQKRVRIKELYNKIY